MHPEPTTDVPEEETGLDYHIQHGVCFSIAVGTPDLPEITRWTSWGHGDLQQSYLLHSSEGTHIIDPVLPKTSDALQALKRYKEEVECEKFPSDAESYQ